MIRPFASCNHGGPTARGRATVIQRAFHGTGGVRSGYLWSVTAGNLPPGIALSNAGGLSGRATVTGSFAFTVQVASGALTDTEDYTIFASPSGTVVSAPLDPSPRPKSWNGHELFTFNRESCATLGIADRVRVGDICIDANSFLWGITATAPTITMRSPSGQKHFTFHADDSEAETTSAAGSEIGTSGRFSLKADLRAVSECRIRVHIADLCTACATIQARYDEAGTPTSLGTSSIEISTTSTGLKDSAFLPIVAAAKTEDETLCLWVTSGDSADNIGIGGASMECR